MLDNLYPESVEASGKFLRLALQRISKHALPYNPITYAVWYEYATGRNEPLIQHIQTLEKDKVEVSFEMILTLFRTFIADNQVLLTEKKAREFQTILGQMTEQLDNSGSKLDDRGNTLKNYARQLNQTTSLEAVSIIAKDIVSETEAVVASGQTLRKQMDETTSEIDTLKKELEGIKQAAKTDMLTGLLNRRGLDEALSNTLKNSLDNSIPFSVILADLDHFKKINDTHGHLVGDNVLKLLSRLLTKHIKGKDIAARFGGEEFILVLPDTPLKGAYVLAEQIRMSLRAMKWATKDSGKPIGTITISLGVAQYKPDEPVKSLIQRADDALYFAKKSGRNKTMTDLDIQAA
ncbi:MAG: GGDEF domain-containing protein [Proteobacteria bacterium]|nr:GGDEF domain-containing protein [Pseudomonadota bacterium]